MNLWTMRRERDGDEAAIAQVIGAAFAPVEWSDGSEAGIVERLRDDGDLEVSYVAVTPSGSLVGHVAFSRVSIGGGGRGWFGLAPLAVLPEWQRRGIGSALVEAGLEDLQRIDAAGCVVLGDPKYYSRFGFAHDPALTFPGALLPDHFQRLVLRGEPPAGEVGYAAAFG